MAKKAARNPTFADAKSASEFRQRFYRTLRDLCGLQGYEKEIADDTFLIYPIAA